GEDARRHPASPLRQPGGPEGCRDLPGLPGGLLRYGPDPRRGRGCYGLV
ncbi:MAG: hypothetical protein AVDCRST_MAG12-584, partial [uncultured Rubrobacteraceae bacterium]